jgi:hypothetical protein
VYAAQYFDLNTFGPGETKQALLRVMAKKHGKAQKSDEQRSQSPKDRENGRRPKKLKSE